MLRTIGFKPIIEDSGPFDLENTIDKVDGGSKICGTKSWMNVWVKSSKSKNKVKPSLVKSQLLVELNSGRGFSTLRARLAFAQLR